MRHPLYRSSEVEMIEASMAELEKLYGKRRTYDELMNNLEMLFRPFVCFKKQRSFLFCKWNDFGKIQGRI